MEETRGFKLQTQPGREAGGRKRGELLLAAFIDSAGMLKRSLVVASPKDSNLLQQVCQNIDWQEAERRHCWLQRGAAP